MPWLPHRQAQTAKQKYICMMGNSNFWMSDARKPDIAKNMPLYTSAPETCPPAAARPLNTGTKAVR